MPFHHTVRFRRTTHIHLQVRLTQAFAELFDVIGYVKLVMYLTLL